MNARSINAKNPVPMFIGLSSVAMVFLLGAAIGFFQPEIAPWLADRAITWSLLFVGLTIDAAALFILFDARQKLARVHKRA